MFYEKFRAHSCSFPPACLLQPEELRRLVRSIQKTNDEQERPCWHSVRAAAEEAISYQYNWGSWKTFQIILKTNKYPKIVYIFKQFLVLRRAREVPCFPALFIYFTLLFYLILLYLIDFLILLSLTWFYLISFHKHVCATYSEWDAVLSA